MDWVLAWEPKGLRFDSRSGHMPGLQARSPVGDVWEATTHWRFSPSLSPFLPLSKKPNQRITHIYSTLHSKWNVSYSESLLNCSIILYSYIIPNLQMSKLRFKKIKLIVHSYKVNLLSKFEILSYFSDTTFLFLRRSGQHQSSLFCTRCNNAFLYLVNEYKSIISKY